VIEGRIMSHMWVTGKYMGERVSEDDRLCHGTSFCISLHLGPFKGCSEGKEITE
jgi:hypothetical protein